MAEIVLALDVDSADAARRLLDRLPALRWAKVGSVLMTREGAPLLAELRERGLQVFLDLKWHDIPNTVAGAVGAAAAQGVSMATVHTLGGDAMLRAAQAAAGSLGLVGVTVLTSHDAASYAGATGRAAVRLEDEVRRLASVAASAGLRGVVCSPAEAEVVRPVLAKGAWIVVPGIRRAADAVGDQARVATPAEAVARGATHLVVGRPILTAPDPAAVLTELLAAAQLGMIRSLALAGALALGWTASPPRGPAAPPASLQEAGDSARAAWQRRDLQAFLGAAGGGRAAGVAPRRSAIGAHHPGSGPGPPIGLCSRE